MLLKVGELFWGEFALRFAHLSGCGGCRVQRPFGSTAQEPYTPARHASRRDIRQSVTGRWGRYDLRRRRKAVDAPFRRQPPPLSATTTGARWTTITRDNSQIITQDRHHFITNLYPPLQSSFFITHHQHVLCPREHRPGHLCLPNVQGLQALRSKVSPRLTAPRSRLSIAHPRPSPRCPHVKDVCRNRSVHPRIDVAYLKNAEGESNPVIDRRQST